MNVDQARIFENVLSGLGADDWGPMADVDAVPTPRPLPLGLLPPAFAARIVDVSERLSVPLEFVAVPMVIALAAVVGRKVVIQPEPGNPWLVVPNLWGMHVADSGMLKTPAQNEAFAPVRRLEKRNHEAFERENRALSERKLIAKLKLEAAEAAFRQASKGGQPTREIEADLQAARAVLDERAIERRYSTQDATIEKLGELVCDNPAGILQLRDEQAGWLKSLEKNGQEGARAFHLEGWNGDSPFTVDRIGRGTVRIPALCILNFGSIQPGVLRRHVADAVRGNEGADGLVQRFGLTVVSLLPPPYRKCERPEDLDARARVDAVFDRCDEIAFSDEGEPQVIAFDDAAQSLFGMWRFELEARIRADGETPAFRAWLTKLRKTVPALALLFHLIDDREPEPLRRPIGKDAILAACAWATVLETHARYIYASAVATPTMLLAAKIRRGDVTHDMTVREVKRRKWSGLTTATDVDAALAELDASGWLRVELLETGGRSSEVIRLHPELRNASDD